VSTKTTLIGLGVAGALLASLFYFRKPIGDYFARALAGAGADIAKEEAGKVTTSLVDQFNALLGLTQTSKTITTDTGTLTPVPGKPNTYNYYTVLPSGVTGQAEIMNPGTESATIDGLPVSQFALKSIYEVLNRVASSGKSAPNIADPKYKKVVENLNVLYEALGPAEQQQVIYGSTPVPKKIDPRLETAGIYNLYGRSIPLSKIALDYYNRLGVYPRRIK